MRVSGSQYYTFEHEPGKYWRNVNDEIFLEEVPLEKKRIRYYYNVNLAWNTTKDIKVELAGCAL